MTSQNCVKLPREIVSVPQSGVETLAASRAVQMGGIAHEKDAAATERGSATFVLLVGCGPERTLPGPFTEELAREPQGMLRELFVTHFIGDRLVDDAPNARRVAHGDQERRNVGGHKKAVTAVEILSDLYIGEEGAGGVGLALQLPSQLLAHLAVRAVRSD